jgi:hypothetical protein
MQRKLDFGGTLGRCYTDEDLQGVAFEKRLDAEALYRKALRVTAADTYKPDDSSRYICITQLRITHHSQARKTNVVDPHPSCIPSVLMR